MADGKKWGFPIADQAGEGVCWLAPRRGRGVAKRARTSGSAKGMNELEVAPEVARAKKRTKGLQLIAVTPCYYGGEIGIRTLGTLRYT